MIFPNRLTGADEDQVPRLARFRTEHPGVVITPMDGGRWWEAVVPAPDGGSVVVCRYFLYALLDRLDVICPA